MKQSESFQMLSLKWQALLKAGIANTFFLQFVALSWLPSTLRSPSGFVFGQGGWILALKKTKYISTE